MLVERLQEPNADLYKPALEQIRSLIRSSTTSMTSVPKPLKFMRLHYHTMKVTNSCIMKHFEFLLGMFFQRETLHWVVMTPPPHHHQGQETTH